MKILSIHLILVFTLLSACGKKEIPKTNPGKAYWDERIWPYADDDNDGKTNQNELDAGSIPEIISIPDLKYMTISGSLLEDNNSDPLFNNIALKLQTDFSPYHLYLDKLTNYKSLPKYYFYNKENFNREHLIIKTEKSFPKPNELFFSFSIDKNYSNLIRKLFYSKNITTDLQNVESKYYSFLLEINFPSSIAKQSLSFINGHFTVDNQIIPWVWNVNGISQNKFQIQLSSLFFSQLLKREKYITLSIDSWQYIGPMSSKLHTFQELDKYFPFYILSEQGLDLGWSYDTSPSYVYKLLSRMDYKKSSNPWTFIKAELPDGNSSLWLKEQSENFSTLDMKYKVEMDDFPITNFSHFEKYKGLKISKTEVYDSGPLEIGVKYTHSSFTMDTPYVRCFANYPGLRKRSIISQRSTFNLEDFLKRVNINGKNLDSLITEGLVVIPNFDSKLDNSIQSISILWPDNFKISSFVFLGHRNDLIRIKLLNPLNCPLKNPADLKSSVIQYIYSNTYNFEWLN